MRIFVTMFIIFISSFHLSGQDNPKMKTFGYVRTFHQSDFENNSSEFTIKMARIGVKGSINSRLSYKFFVDFARQGKLSTESADLNGEQVISDVSATFSNYLLDAYGKYEIVDDVSITAGQFKIPFSSDNLLAASKLPFSNRPLVYSITPGLRDIGAMVSAKFLLGFPWEVSGGLFNGAGFNKKEDDLTTNYSLRLKALPVKFLSLTANMYSGRFSGPKTDFMNFGAEYKNKNLWVAGEYSIKKTNETYDVTSNAWFIYMLYDIPVNINALKFIQPGIRIGRLDRNADMDNDELNRYTAGINFNFTESRNALFRLNYESNQSDDGTGDYDRMILEFQIKF